MIVVHCDKVMKDNDTSQIENPSNQDLTQMDGICIK